MKKLSARLRSQRQLDQESFRWLHLVKQELKTVLGEETILSVNQLQRYQLLTLKSWCFRYTIELRWLLDFLLNQYFCKVRAQRKNKDRLGISITTLVSRKVEGSLEEAILKAFPHEENKAIYREKILAELMSGSGFYPRNSKVHSAIQLIEDYSQWVEKQRDQRQRLQLQLARRPWRGNPFR